MYRQMSGFRICRDYVSENRDIGNEKRREEAKVAACGGRVRRPARLGGVGTETQRER